MAYWLLKTEPDCYAWSNLEHDKRTIWDGITNALALKHLRTFNKGDLALIYHTGDERQAIGVAEVVKAPYVDPKADGDDKLAVVDVKIKKKLPRAVTLDEIKADPAFGGWDLIRNSRLSVVPVPEKLWKRIEQLAAASVPRASRP